MNESCNIAGGLGTRLSEETSLRPKPMIEIGDNSILWHILKIYSFYDINEFIICCGYKGKLFKDYFLNYYSNSSDFTLDQRQIQLILIIQQRGLRLHLLILVQIL